MKGGLREQNQWPMIRIGAAFIGDFFRLGLDLLYPPMPICPLCGRIIKKPSGLRLCHLCLDKMSFIRKPICDRCGRPTRLASSTPCPECRGRNLFYRRSRSVGLYREYFRQAILTMKYRGRPELAEPLAELMAERLKGDKALRRVDVLVPVPLHGDRWMERGYNQAELLARHIGQRTQLPLVNDALSRIKKTGVQNQLSREERLTNVAGAFSVPLPGKVGGKSVLLIDDILTTGSTASECAKVLLAAGARTVDVLTLAVGVVEDQWLKDIEDMEV